MGWSSTHLKRSVPLKVSPGHHSVSKYESFLSNAFLGYDLASCFNSLRIDREAGLLTSC